MVFQYCEVVFPTLKKKGGFHNPIQVVQKWLKEGWLVVFKLMSFLFWKNMSFGYYFNLYAISLATNWNELEFGT